jgi:hypothetical protein
LPKHGENRNVILETPLQRIFPELTDITQYQREKRTSVKVDQVKEQEVVEIIDKYRKDLLEEEVNTSLKSISLNRDNVSPDKMVDIIKEQRKEVKMERFYQKDSWPIRNPLVKDKVNECLLPKLDEIKTIFEENELTMEWEKIVNEMAKVEAKACGQKETLPKELISRAVGNYSDILRYHVQEKLIKRLEDHKLVKKYTILNKEFEKRVKEENRETDVKNMNEKRVQKSPKQSYNQKKRGVDNEKN